MPGIPNPTPFYSWYSTARESVHACQKPLRGNKQDKFHLLLRSQCCPVGVFEGQGTVFQGVRRLVVLVLVRGWASVEADRSRRRVYPEISYTSLRDKGAITLAYLRKKEPTRMFIFIGSLWDVSGTIFAVLCRFCPSTTLRKEKGSN